MSDISLFSSPGDGAFLVSLGILLLLAAAVFILWTVVPGGNFEDFFEELAALPADREPDLGKVVEIFARYGMEVLIPQQA